MRKLIKTIVEDNTTKGGRVFDITMIVLIILSLVSYSLDTLPNLNQEFRASLRYLEIFIVFIFTVEYVLRWIVADKKWIFIKSWYGLFDLLAIFPFYLSFFLASGIDLRYVRVFRMFRLFRAFKLVRYSRALNLFSRAFSLAKEELLLFLMLTIMLLYLSAALIYHFENPVQPDHYSSIFSSLWWAVVTLTTVGYGDMVPCSFWGRFFTFIVLIIGIGTIAVPSGIVASALSQARERQDQEASNAGNEKER